MAFYLWISVDPVRGKIDIYPKHIALLIEEDFKKNKVNCVLGDKFFNATIYFASDGKFHQTTPGISMGRMGIKKPGFRTVKRVYMLNPDNNTLYVPVKLHHRECRIDYHPIEDARVISCTIPEEDKIYVSETIPVIHEKMTCWNGEDLNNNNDKDVIVWQWCKKTNQNITTLNDSDWMPYLVNDNKMIEEAFENNHNSIEIRLFDNTIRTIQFVQNNIYGFQMDYINNKKRVIRRVIIKISKLKELICNKQENSEIDSDKIPHEFICAISQELMKDPVKTVDGFTYEREAITRWFSQSNKSPLTGLDLTDKSLVPDIICKQEIDKFIESIKNLELH